MTFTREEANALLQICSSAQYSGEEVIAVSSLMQKLNSYITSESTPVDKPKPIIPAKQPKLAKKKAS